MIDNDSVNLEIDVYIYIFNSSSVIINNITWRAGRAWRGGRVLACPHGGSRRQQPSPAAGEQVADSERVCACAGAAINIMARSEQKFIYSFQLECNVGILSYRSDEGHLA